MLSEIMDLAPDNSTCQASMAKFGNTFTAWLEITSPVGNFTAEARGDDAKHTLAILDDRIKLKIKKMIEAEDSRNPLTDDEIAKILAREGQKLSRRTVAKYRDQMKIPGSRERRQVV